MRRWKQGRSDHRCQSATGPSPNYYKQPQLHHHAESQSRCPEAHRLVRAQACAPRTRYRMWWIGAVWSKGSGVLRVPMNRYPRLGRVSMNRGESAESPNASRRRLMALFKPTIEVDECICRPKLLLQILTGDHLAGLERVELRAPKRVDRRSSHLSPASAARQTGGPPRIHRTESWELRGAPVSWLDPTWELNF